MTTLLSAAALPLATAMIALLMNAAAVAKSAEPIRIALNQATSQKVIAVIAGEALRQAGFKVDFVEVAVAEQYSRIAAGEVHVQPDATGLTANADYDTALASGGIVDLGPRAETGDARKIVWSGVRGKWPGAEKLLRNMTLSADDQAAMALEIDGKGRDIDVVTGEWMRNNSRSWKRWKAASTNWMKP